VCAHNRTINFVFRGGRLILKIKNTTTKKKGFMMQSRQLITSIYHEKQDAALCALHSINALLQGQYFTEIDLATIARRLDAQEQSVLSQQQQEQHKLSNAATSVSNNLDDDGNFSIQVLQVALKDSFDLQLSNLNHPQNQFIELDSKQAYICNYQSHWFTLRKFGYRHWFNLNSINSWPTYLSNTYLSLFIAQLQNEGYSIFVVDGVLPVCQADEIASTLDTFDLQAQKEFEEEKKKQIQQKHQKQREQKNQCNNTKISSSYDEQLQQAIQNSIVQQKTDNQMSKEEEEELEIAKAISLSLTEENDD
jgi:ataxin-3